jgi:hypothetical protein
LSKTPQARRSYRSAWMRHPLESWVPSLIQSFNQNVQSLAEATHLDLEPFKLFDGYAHACLLCDLR